MRRAREQDVGDHELRPRKQRGDHEDLHQHGYSEWSSINPDQLPVAVAYPRSTEDVSQIAKVCHKYRMPMIPYSGGSSLEGNFSAPFGGMSIDFAFMDKIIELHADDMDVVVQPSMQWMHLNDQIKDSGLFFPIDPGPSAKIGGMVGTNCSGTNAVRYGTMKDWVLNLTVVLADGRHVVVVVLGSDPDPADQAGDPIGWPRFADARAILDQIEPGQ